METTEPINGNDFEAVAANLIMNMPQNPDVSTAKAAKVTDDGQSDVDDDVEENQDDIETQADDNDDLGEDYEEAEESEVQQEPVFTVKVDGVEKEVSLDELKRGYSGQKYIQKGMAEVADVKKEIEQVQHKVAQERQVLINLMQQVQNGDIPKVPEYPSEELRSSDPLGFLEAEAGYRRAIDRRNQWEQQVRYVAQQDANQKEQQNNQFLEQQALRLAEWMPEFADPRKRSAFIKETTEKAKRHYKLTDEQIGHVKTADEVVILRDAIKWRELQAGKSNAEKKAEGARPVVKPAAKRATISGQAAKSKNAAANMRNRGDADSVANWLLS